MTKPKIKTQFTVADQGKLFTTNGKDIYVLKKFVPEPWVSFEPITDLEGDPTPKEHLIGKYEGLVSEMGNYVRLVPETDPPLKPKRAYRRKQENNNSGGE
jgi:hypothetical protein